MSTTSRTGRHSSPHRYPVLWAAGFATAPEAAELMACCLRTLRFRQAQGEMPPRYSRGRLLIYRRADTSTVARFLAMCLAAHSANSPVKELDSLAEPSEVAFQPFDSRVFGDRSRQTYTASGVENEFEHERPSRTKVAFLFWKISSRPFALRTRYRAHTADRLSQ